MEYKVNITMKDGTTREFTTTAKTRVALKLKVNNYLARKNIDEDKEVAEIDWQPVGEPVDEFDTPVTPDA